MNGRNGKEMLFVEKYGPWALVAGASRGLGRSFARCLAKRGLHLVLVARTEKALAGLAVELESGYQVQTLPLPVDLSTPDGLERIAAATETIDVGLVVYNAALADTGPFLDRGRESLTRLVATNCAGPLFSCRHFGQKMAERGRGGIVLMSSMSGFQGTPYVAAYAASKAFNLVLAEGLWYELKSANVDVLACCPGPTATPGFNDSLQGKRPPVFPPVLSPQRVAERTLRNLGKRSVLVPSPANRMSYFLIQKLMPRQAGVRIMGKSTGRMYGRASSRRDTGRSKS
jgi:short-subunit dehydrogenase